MQENNSYTVVSGKKFLAKPNDPTPLKCQMVDQ